MGPLGYFVLGLVLIIIVLLAVVGILLTLIKTKRLENEKLEKDFEFMRKENQSKVDLLKNYEKIFRKQDEEERVIHEHSNDVINDFRKLQNGRTKD